MSNILFFHEYTTKYVVINGVKKLKKLIYTNNCMGNRKIVKIGGTWIKSDSYAAIFFVTGSHNKTENEICQLEHYNNKAAICNTEN
jgi:hypothetical protein